MCESGLASSSERCETLRMTWPIDTLFQICEFFYSQSCEFTTLSGLNSRIRMLELREKKDLPNLQICEVGKHSSTKRKTERQALCVRRSSSRDPSLDVATGKKNVQVSQNVLSYGVSCVVCHTRLRPSCLTESENLRRAATAVYIIGGVIDAEHR